MGAHFRRWTVDLEEEFGHADITERVRELVAQSDITTGTVTVGMTGSTCGVTTIEYESGALLDLQRALALVAPANDDYAHNTRWGDGNGFSHIRSALLKPSLSIPIVESALCLGTWQQIVVLNFDNRARRREVNAVVIGE